MYKDAICSDCGQGGPRPEFRGGRGGKLKFFCPGCQKEFLVEDRGFGYLPMRMAKLRESYPAQTQSS